MIDLPICGFLFKSIYLCANITVSIYFLLLDVLSKSAYVSMFMSEADTLLELEQLDDLIKLASEKKGLYTI